MTTPPTGAELRDAALHSIEAAEQFQGDWYAAVYGLTRQIARTHELFTTDDVWARARSLGAPRTDPRVMGAVMRRIARDDIAYRTRHYRDSTRPCCHRRPIPIWQSRIYDPSAL